MAGLLHISENSEQRTWARSASTPERGAGVIDGANPRTACEEAAATTATMVRFMVILDKISFSLLSLICPHKKKNVRMVRDGHLKGPGPNQT